MSQIVVNCPNCNTTVSVGGEFVGRRIRCGACNGFFAVAQDTSQAMGPTPYAPQIPPAPALATGQPPQHPFADAPAWQHPQSSFHCPYCQSTAGVFSSTQISTAGWVVFAIMLVLCWPFFFIGLLIKEDVHHCRNCAAKIQFP